MPYIATDLDAFDAAQGVAGATGLPLQHVLGGLALLWRWCWRGKVDRASGEQICALLGSTHAGLLPALLAFGFIEGLAEHGYHVRGVARYLHISAARSAAGKVRAANAKRSSKGRLESSKPPAPIQHVLDTPPAAVQHATSSGPALTATSDERMDLPSEGNAGAFRLTTPPAKKTRKRSRQELLCEQLRQNRTSVLGTDALPDERYHAARVNEMLGPMVEASDEALFGAHDLYLADSYALAMDPPCPLWKFAQEWGKWVSKVMRANGTGGK